MPQQVLSESVKGSISTVRGALEPNMNVISGTVEVVIVAA